MTSGAEVRDSIDVIVTHDGEQHLVLVAGRLTNEDAPQLANELEDIKVKSGELVIVDLEHVEHMDSAGVAVLLEAREDLLERGASLRIRNASESTRKVFAISLARVDELDEAGSPAFWDPITSAGDAAMRFGHQVEEMAIQAGDMSYWFAVAPFHGHRMRWRETIRQAGLIGADAVPIVSLISLLIGLIMGLQAADQLRQFGASIFVADLVGISVTRELGPLMTAIIVAGRSGSSIAAELGTMVVSEEIDALRTMGLNPVRYLVIPRLLALLIALPCLVMIADAVAIFGGLLVGTVNLGIGANSYINQTIQALYMSDIVSGLVKAVVFGAVIANVAVFQGFHVRGGAESVGKATTAAVVNSILIVIVADALFTALFYFID